VLAAAAAGASLPAAGSAENADELQRQADALRAENDALAAGSQTAVADLASIESRLAAFRARAARVRAERQDATEQLRIVRSAFRATQSALADRLRTVYEQGDTDVLELVLGSGSLDDALSAMETLDLAAEQDEALLHRARHASKRLAAAARALAGRERELEQLAAARAAAAASLADARSERLQTIAQLRAARNANRGRIAALDSRARQLASVQAPAPVPAPPEMPGAPALPSGAAAAGVRSLTVVATAYALPGTTATGRPVGWGVVAVDPSVIPLGTRMTIPGYGEGVAADTGSAVKGAIIDLWFPTTPQALAWGRRTVTITLHG
jgi:3D (Asp-Asp-Asp) domain-containing protein/peptidoglycan hydrolase CwlO-like protein